MRRKPVKHSKTMWFSLLLVVFGALFDNFSSIQGVISDKYYGYSYIVIGVVVAILRFFTTKPIE